MSHAPCSAESVDNAMTPKEFVDAILSACDPSNWDSERNKGERYRGLYDAYEDILQIAVEYQTAMYKWTRRDAEQRSAVIEECAKVARVIGMCMPGNDVEKIEIAIRALAAIPAPAQAESEETPTKEDFAKWSRAWHDTCDTILTLLGLPGNGSPQEMLAQVQDYVGRAPPQAESIKDIREKAEEAIRTFCYSLGAATVKTSSDGMDRIYYSGISLDALAAAVAIALTRPHHSPPGEQK